MIPSTVGFLDQDLVIEQLPSKNYKMDLNGDSIRGLCDGLKSIQQIIYKILNTERYKYIIYSWNYGIELHDLYGQPVSYVCSELQRRITEALTQDDRITSVDNFEFDTSEKRVVKTKFIVHTVLGDVLSEKVVSF